VEDSGKSLMERTEAVRPVIKSGAAGVIERKKYSGCKKALRGLFYSLKSVIKLP
jgi:hypothetical protein